MKNLTSILYGLILCGLLIFVIKLSMPDEPEGMVLIPAGDGVEAFYIDVYEVTNAQFKRFIDENPQWRKSRALTAIVDDNYLSGWKGNIYPTSKADHPVVDVSWFAAKAYAEWVGKELPTEAQWERAARGTLACKEYPWGDGDPHNRANYDRYTSGTDFRNPPTKIVGSYAPNAYGLYDMAGNVEEWCLERLNVNDIHRRYHRMRGGSWFSGAKAIQIEARSQHPVDEGIGTLGFRCVLPQIETKTTKIATDMATWLYENMRNQFDSAIFSVAEGFTPYASLDAKFAKIVMHNTGYPRTFEKELMSVLSEVLPDRIADIQDEESDVYRDVILRLWRHYLEVHFEHSSESEFEKLRIFKACLKKNVDNIFQH